MGREQDQVELTNGELRRLNRQLLKVGRRICSCCHTNFDLSQFSRNGEFYRGECKGCNHNRYAIADRKRKRERERYQNDPAVRLKARLRSHIKYASNPELANQDCKQRRQRKKLEYLRKLLTEEKAQ